MHQKGKRNNVKNEKRLKELWIWIDVFEPGCVKRLNCRARISMADAREPNWSTYADVADLELLGAFTFSKRSLHRTRNSSETHENHSKPAVFTQFSHTSSSKASRQSKDGRERCLSAPQPAKAQSPMWLTDSGIVRLMSCADLAKAYSSIFVTDSGSTRLVRAEWVKAKAPISKTSLEIWRCTKELQPLKARRPEANGARELQGTQRAAAVEGAVADVLHRIGHRQGRQGPTTVEAEGRDGRDLR